MLVKDVTAYSLNPEIYSNRTYYISTLKEMNIFKSVERICFKHVLTDRLRTIITAHLYALITAFDKNDFPLLLLEDDARLFNSLPENINIPEECSIVYWGGSLYNHGLVMYIKEYNHEYYRVFNMLSAHAILIKDKIGWKIMMDAYTKALNDYIFNDVSLGVISNTEVFLTPKDGLYFYQEGIVENITKFLWKDHQNLLSK